MGPGQAGERTRAHWIQSNGMFESRPCGGDIPMSIELEMFIAPQHVVICCQASHWCPESALDASILDPTRDHRDYRCDDLVLNREYVIDFTIIAVSPQMDSAISVDQLCCDSNTISGPSHAAFNNIMRAKLTADILHLW